ncbi:hypothetical protein A3C23_04935 [Candidatus Roizmanbacteria bacterium RIFCSPHIGHO2_02_FULL_37_13b]|uniref:Addiction module toxin RelE n=1 Tax=Candidatus Roizmanbacteria bacterium RIFCSPLOWO2_02_FULL_36_11 TaxID=1802071 RepID=A0A1F7JCV0_9BACT|nr:MAG: hypothetical protein A3C23_04935 [Candidatus Roizmanbacteria bacterium RIFCSPHIGHO2_02_FULL_37_13b]OGK53431.1 MAG: hypothetical protein A3H78_02760 [Candidatus Roizmanbacteria bacterium RIFCSPLOWO2_02_FULL_36_11]
MYEIRFSGSKVKKKYKKLLKNLSVDVKKKLREILENNPYPLQSGGEVLNRVEKKGPYYCYPITGGDRIIYDIYENPKKTLMIVMAGNHDEELRFLKKVTK